MTQNQPPQSPPDIRILGVRHHGPGSAHCLREELERLQPTMVLVEGPPEANDLLHWVGHKEMEPPIALIVYRPDEPKKSTFYPFAIFSPELQAIRHALENDVTVRFMDLPQGHFLANAVKFQAPNMYPLRELAQAAGYKEYEPWWNLLIEQRSDSTDIFLGILEAMRAAREASESDAAKQKASESDAAKQKASESDAAKAKQAKEADPDRKHSRDPRDGEGTGLLPDGQRDEPPQGSIETDGPATSPPLSSNNVDAEEIAQQEAERAELVHQTQLLADRREAHMRQSIRNARAEGHTSIAVVCGAWHGPALADIDANPDFSAEADAAILAELPVVDVECAWVPWTYSRLSYFTGYGAGIPSPGWYHHLWDMRRKGATSTESSVVWLTKIAGLLRDERLDASSAHIIEAVRLAESLAAMRNLPIPGLQELMEATQTVMCFGDPTPMQLIQMKLIVSERMGSVPPDTPMAPLQRNLYELQKRLRMRAQPEKSRLALDLRNEMHMERSHLLHRLLVLNIPWGTKVSTGARQGTFREVWRLQWKPELSIRVIEANIWGNTVLEAATTFAQDVADKATDLPTLTKLLDQIILAELPEVIEHLMRRIEDEATIRSDVPLMMDALPPLARVLRYGSVRQTDRTAVSEVVDALLTRIYVGLPSACASLDQEAAGEMFKRISSVHTLVGTLKNHEQTQKWYKALSRLLEQKKMHGLVAGRACRLLLNSSQLKADEAKAYLATALSVYTLSGKSIEELLQGAFWIEGFMKGSELLLLHDEALFPILDEWVTQLGEEHFMYVLPLLRRTFSSFSDATREQIRERVKGEDVDEPVIASPIEFDSEQADKTSAVLEMILGL